MIASESIKIVFSAIPIGPCGLDRFLTLSYRIARLLPSMSLRWHDERFLPAQRVHHLRIEVQMRIHELRRRDRHPDNVRHAEDDICQDRIVSAAISRSPL